MTRRNELGVALLGAILIALLFALSATAVILLTGRERESAIVQSRALTAVQCAEAGIQYGKWLFGRHEVYVRWNDILRDAVLRMQGAPPVGPTAWNAAVDLHHPEFQRKDQWRGPICARVRCELFGMNVDINGDGRPDFPGDLDGDGLPDFRVSIRDNIDEFGDTWAACQSDPAIMAEQCLGRDNDLTVIVRAECINARLSVGKGTSVFEASSDLDQDADTRDSKVIEAVLRYVPDMDQYAMQRAGGMANTGNVNR